MSEATGVLTGAEEGRSEEVCSAEEEESVVIRLVYLDAQLGVSSDEVCDGGSGGVYLGRDFG